MSIQDWLKCIGVGAITLLVVVLVMMGVQGIIVDTGRAIFH